MRAPTLLVGDVGGTNCRFALAEKTAQNTIELHGSHSYPVKNFDSFEDALTHYLDETGFKPNRAAFALAGPKFDGSIQMTNINWAVSESALVQHFALDEVVICNDFVAMANGARIIPDDGFQTLIAGKVNYNRPVAVMGPGTGMGVSSILPARPPRIMATEGGQSAFAPQTDLEIEILNNLRAQLSFVSAEHILSGPGLYRLYKAMCDIRGQNCVLSLPNEVVAAAEANPGSLARETVVLFNTLLGGFAGNTALTLGAFGGVVIGGGVARHVAPFMAESDFTKRFLNRGKGGGFLKDVPVRLILARFVPLYGAAATLMQL